MKQTIVSGTGFWQGLVLAGLVVAVYANTLDNSFHYDDLHMIVENPHIRNLANILQFFTDPTTFSRDPEYAMYRPLVITTIAINYAVSGNNVQSYHVLNIFLHVSCSFVVWGILLKLGRMRSIALCGAVVFALHPVCTEPVNYISSRSELLSALFVLSSFYFYQCYSISRNTMYFCMSMVCFSFGLLSKSIAITTIALLGMFELYRHGDFRRLFSVDTIKTFLPFGILSIGYLIVINEFMHKAIIGEPVRSLSQQFGTQSKAIIYYAKLLLFPKGLSVHHQFFESSWNVAVMCSCLVIVSLAVLIFKIHPKQHSVIMGTGWVLITLSPTIIMPLHIMVNDHRLYLPLVGLIIFITSYSCWFSRIVKVIILSLVVFSGILVMQRNKIWTDEYTLWSDVAKKSPTPFVPVAYVHLGNYAKEHSSLEEAIRYFQKALDISPKHVAALNNMATVYQQLGQYENARAIYEKLLKEKGNIPEAHYNLGKVFQETGQFEKAISHYSFVSSNSPHYAVALNNAGTAYELFGKIDSAVFLYRKALENDPNFRDAIHNLERFNKDWLIVGQKLMRTGQAVLVEKTSVQLLDAFPNHRDALFMLSASLFVQRRYSESLIQNEKLISAHPNFVEGYLQIGNVLETIGKFARAKQGYETILQIKSTPEFDTLAKERLEKLKRLGHS